MLSYAFWKSRKRRDSLPSHFRSLSNHSQPPRDLLKGATVHDQTCPCVHWIRWRMFLAFVVNCYSINSTNWKVIKLGTYIVNVLSVLRKTLRNKCTYLWLQPFIKFPDICCVYEHFLFALMWRPHPWSLSKNCRHILCQYNNLQGYVSINTGSI
jgi:hypothetical protein